MGLAEFWSAIKTVFIVSTGVTTRVASTRPVAMPATRVRPEVRTPLSSLNASLIFPNTPKRRLVLGTVPTSRDVRPLYSARTPFSATIFRCGSHGSFRGRVGQVPWPGKPGRAAVPPVKRLDSRFSTQDSWGQFQAISGARPPASPRRGAHTRTARGRGGRRDGGKEGVRKPTEGRRNCSAVAATRHAEVERPQTLTAQSNELANLGVAVLRCSCICVLTNSAAGARAGTTRRWRRIGGRDWLAWRGCLRWFGRADRRRVGLPAHLWGT